MHFSSSSQHYNRYLPTNARPSTLLHRPHLPFSTSQPESEPTQGLYQSHPTPKYTSVECERCGDIVRTSGKSQWHYKKHLRSARCARRVGRQTASAERAAADAQRRTLFSQPALSSSVRQPLAGNTQPAGTISRCASGSEPYINCYQCGKRITEEKARSHVGSHVLRALLGVSENVKELTIPSTACGFCGRPGCVLSLSTTALPPSTHPEVSSSCPRAHHFVLGKAKRSSARMPSTNVPIRCLLCPQTAGAFHWKFSIFHHIRVAHPLFWDSSKGSISSTVPQIFADTLAITSEELDRIAADAPLTYPGPVI
ncbi:hypothetical protein PsYK624_122550 [Phanerochaete sordida]|uniref:Uncharacterized protein n=1 Tax=Phanerochaete sordida TaxID=48140 RepID=A0A9P3GJ22_9APHY|nr:hypothetical protein PsYK624_122550 [Phanerochaete sordida]